MAKADGVFIYIGTYPSEDVARDDYDDREGPPRCRCGRDV